MMTSRPATRPERKLSSAELATFEALLFEQRRFRLDQLAEFSRQDEAGVTTAEREVAGALEHGARQAVAEIERALDRLRSGHYGRCVDCGDAVGRDRLEVLPAAARCLSCQYRVSHGRSAPRRPRAVLRRHVGSAR